MSTYSDEEEENVILKDNNEIISINLKHNPNLKVLIVDNLSELERINIYVTDGLYVSISNCEKLSNINIIECSEDDQYGSYFYLGENLKSLEIIFLDSFKILKVADEIFDKLISATLSNIKSLICNFNNFPKLEGLTLENVVASNLIVDSEIISLVSLSYCSFENIEITGKGHINAFEFYNNEYKSLKTENLIKISYLLLYHDNEITPYIPLSDEIYEILIFYINVDSLYDSHYKFFIERNSSKIELVNKLTLDKITLDDMKFNVAQKKCAR